MRILLACLFSLFTLPLAAQDRPSAILVLDASGSMWGQIDGKAKIEIAQSVVGDLLTDLPAEQALGLTVYGHRVKGDCSDIETLVLPGGDTRAAIASAVNGISPKGKTPLSDAVIQAAEALKYTEEAATVILVTDGLETCERDPCAVGRALEQNGIGFTAHVIGFDVAVEDRDQLQCLADETGGKFLSASNADELSLALTEVAEEPAAPAPVLVTFIGAETEDGPPVAYDLIWDLSGPDGRVFTGFQGSSSDAQLLPGGAYQITALRPEDSAQASASFTAPDQATTVTVVLPVVLPQASLRAPDTANIGALVDVTWDGPDAENDYVSVADPEEENRYIRYGYTRKGNPTEVRMPPEPGTYELRYQLGDGGDIIARRMIEVLDVPVTLTAPDTAPVGSVVDVVFDGPDEDRDYISVADPDEKTRYIRYGYTRNGSPTEVRMPDTPGLYELRYQFGEGGRILARRPIEVVAVEVTLTAPDTAPIGSVVDVEWIGPDEDRDYVSVADPDEKTRYIRYGYTRNGSPAEVRMPDTPGTYELRYQLGEGGKILARRPIEVTGLEVTLTAPDTAPIGSVVDVEWIGPDEDRDYVSVADPDEKARYIRYGYTRNGSPAEVRMPDTPGTYELRYQLGEGGKILARRPIEVTGLDVTLIAPDSAPMGSTLGVEWVGPDEDRDYVSVADPDEKTRYLAYGYTRHGSPTDVLMPDAPGTYELRYQLGEGGKILARKMITITEVSATLSGPTTAKVGETIEVTWDGPDYDRDYISVADPDEKTRYIRYGYTRNGSPAEVRMPDTPGAYELRYQMGGTNKVIGTLPITVTQ